MKTVNTLLSLAVLAGSAGAQANPLLQPHGFPGFIVLAEQRYDAAVQRFMAARSLRALPLRDGQLFYVYPADTSRAHLEEMQIRYLEVLLDEQQRGEKRANDEPATD